MLYHRRTGHVLTTVSATRHLPHRCETVYSAALYTPLADRNLESLVLAAKRIWGQRDSVGSQTLLRMAEGSFDIEVIETILEIDPPLRFVARQKPQRYLPYTPQERVPPFNFDDRPPDRVFAQVYGDNPISWVIAMDFQPRQGGCDLTLQISLSEPVKGWLARRLWTKRASKQIETSIDAISAVAATIAAPN